MKILAVGDIVGNAGIKELKKRLHDIRVSEKIDFVIVNGENAAEGMGITVRNFEDILSQKVDVITMGNHTWGKRDIFSLLEEKALVIPANYPEGVHGKGYDIYECKGKKICVINLLGRVDINVLTENPFVRAREIVDKVRKDVDIIVIDFHAEATAEKIAFANYLDGDVEIVFGTHTHVQTADERILPKGTGYISDIGMTGPTESVIGMNVEASVKRFVTTLPERYKIAEGETALNGVIFEIDDNTNKVKSIKRVK